MQILRIQVSPVFALVVGGDKVGELFYMATWLPLCVRLYQIRKNENEIGVSDLFPKSLVLKRKEYLIPLTKLSPFVMEKSIKSCAGEVKNVTKKRSGDLIIECQRRQQSVNILSLKQIHNVEISSSPPQNTEK